ncbi:MAG TPA: aminotransferase class I/II-fold pyridoxal phosphate-dependent enzyme [Chloroflexota bacterium]|nr:aminotransferase class I/II-fold pyridoxal phosphate-dependent enzyme [Chloroflexota bacterium]
MQTISEPTAEPRGRKERIAARVRDVPPSGIRRFFDLIQTMEGVISLGVGEPDFTTPWHIREAAIYSLERGYTMYTSNYGLIELRQAIAEHLARRYGVAYDPQDEILITFGVSEGLDLAMRAILDPGDEVLVPDPGYVSYAPCVVFAGGEVCPVPTSAEHGFHPRPADFGERVSERTRAILLGYPNNPTGIAPGRKTLAEIAKVAEENDLLVVSDEIYDRLVYGRDHVCFASLPGMRDRTILLGGFSKAYAMTGWRVGYVAAPRDIIAGLVKIHQYTALCAPITGQMAAIEAIKNGEPDVASMVEEYDRRRRVMVRGFNDLGLTCPEPEGAFYAFPSIRSLDQSDEEFAEQLLREEKVAVVPGSAFGACGRGHVRCCYATSLSQIEEALRRIGAYVKRKRKA